MRITGVEVRVMNIDIKNLITSPMITMIPWEDAMSINPVIKDYKLLAKKTLLLKEYCKMLGIKLNK